MRFKIVLILFLLSSCAQVGILNGGAKDEFAPKPDLDKMVPRNAITSYNGKELIIPFDEYIKLKNPSETIVVVPPNIRPKAKIKKKSLVISWEEDLLPNTTYAFYLNGTVVDTRENNDSLMTFVFSTGPFIDSLTAQYFVKDAFTNEPQKGFILGLYNEYSDTIKPTYFSQTDVQGKATLSYLKPGKYDVVAFLDKNKDLKHQIDEPFGFKIENLDLSENFTDSIPIRTYIPQQIPKITRFTFNPPGSFLVTANRSLKNASFELNGEIISDDNFHNYNNDSIVFSHLISDTSVFTLIVNGENWADTSALRISQKEKKQSISLQFAKNNELLPNNSFILLSSARIENLNTPLILVQNAADSSFLTIRSLNFLGNQIEMNFDRNNSPTVNLIFLPGAIVGKNMINTDTIKLKANCLAMTDLGNLSVDISTYEETVILEIWMGKKLVDAVPMKKSYRKHTFINLKPGEYSFRFIYDQNENARWDVGNRALKIQPEFVEIFPETKKVRANWDVEIVLKKATNGTE